MMSLSWTGVVSVSMRWARAGRGGRGSAGRSRRCGPVWRTDADGQVQPGPGGAAAHEVGKLEGEHAGEHVDADVVLGPVEHRAEGGYAGVFHLPEEEDSASDWDR